MIILGIINTIAYNFDLTSYFNLKSTMPLLDNIITFLY